MPRPTSANRSLMFLLLGARSARAGLGLLTASALVRSGRCAPCARSVRTTARAAPPPDDRAAALGRGVGDAAEVPALVAARSVGSSVTSRSMVRRTTFISMVANAAPRQRRVPPPNGIHWYRSGRAPTNRYGSNVARGSGTTVSSSWIRAMLTSTVVPLRQRPPAELEAVGLHLAADHVDHRTGALHLEDRRLAQRAAARVHLLDQRAAAPRGGGAAARPPRPASSRSSRARRRAA